MKITSLILVGAMACLAVASCDSDKLTPPVEVSPYHDLNSEDDVLFNLNLAYNQRNSGEFERLLDGGFKFVFSEADYNEGIVPFREWDRVDEVNANRQILDPDLPRDDRVVSISLTLTDTLDQWTPEPPNEEHPGETWYTKIIDYDLVAVTANHWEYRALDHQAEIKIRTDVANGTWKIIRWIDEPRVITSLSPGGSTVEHMTWGTIKALYYVSPFGDLTSKDDVLANLELAYNERNPMEFNRLLDGTFTFIFSEADYNGGVVDLPQWDRAAEVMATRNIFDPNLPVSWRVIAIDLNLDYAEDDWTELPPNETHPDESWYTQTVDYDLVVKSADDWEHRALALSAQFTIRQNPYSGRWQVVLWRDDVASAVALSPGGTAVEETTWGGIKAMYRDAKKDQ